MLSAHFLHGEGESVLPGYKLYIRDIQKTGQRAQAKKKPGKKYRTDIKAEYGSAELQEKGVHFWISELTEFEIKNSLMAEEKLTFEQANSIFQGWLSNCPIYAQATVFKDFRISYDFLNWANRHHFKLNDAMHIMSATKLGLYLITKERNLEKWKRAYTFVMSPEDFQRYLRTLKPR